MRLVDTMLFRYLYVAGLLEHALRLPQLGITTPVRKEIKLKWIDRYPGLVKLVEKAIETGNLGIYDVDQHCEQETFLYSDYWNNGGFGEGESASMAVAYCRGYVFMSHDLDAVARMRSLGIRVGDWPDLLAEIVSRNLATAAQVAQAAQRIRGMLSGR